MNRSSFLWALPRLEMTRRSNQYVQSSSARCSLLHRILLYRARAFVPLAWPRVTSRTSPLWSSNSLYHWRGTAITVLSLGSFPSPCWKEIDYRTLPEKEACSANTFLQCSLYYSFSGLKERSSLHFITTLSSQVRVIPTHLYQVRRSFKVLPELG